MTDKTGNGRKFAFAVLALFGALIVALVIGEIVVRVLDSDWRYVKKLLYYSGSELELPYHQPDPDPRVMFRLRPGSSQDLIFWKVSINSQGARSPERSAAKLPGVFRIAVLGGSNVFGIQVSNEQTWPARLEAYLNKNFPGRFEVWNYGTCSYVLSQMMVVAEGIVENLDPDLVIIAPSNFSGPAFLLNTPVEPYFERHPELWEHLFAPDSFGVVDAFPYQTQMSLITHSRLYRFSILALREAFDRQTIWQQSKKHNPASFKAYERFVGDYAKRTRLCLFFYPGMTPYVERYGDVPAFVLSADKIPEKDKPTYKNIHPPAYVLDWYADRFSAWLIETGVVDTQAVAGQNVQYSSEGF